jgi:histone H3/H4
MSEMEVELPKALIKRIVKAKLAEQADLGDEEGKRDFQLNKDATTAFSQATKVFITYVSSAAHDICRENNRSTVAPQDIIQALDELCFQDFIPDLQDLLAGAHRRRIQQSFHAALGRVHVLFLCHHGSGGATLPQKVLDFSQHVFCEHLLALLERCVHRECATAHFWTY